MLPRELKSEQFSSYPPEARKLATDYIGILQRLKSLITTSNSLLSA
jgi:hypothetical protein